MNELNLILVIIHYVIAVLAVVHVVMDNRQPAKTMAWAVVIWFVPFAGVILYLFFGINTRKERMISQRQLDDLSKRSMLGFVEQQGLTLPEEHKPVIDLFINQSFSLPFILDDVEVYTDGYQFFPALLAAIGKARSHIHIDTYIIEEDPLGNLVADMLASKAREGVEVRLIYDDVGCWNVRHRFFERMREEGIEAVPFLPVRFPSFTSKVNYRNHRKLMVIDGEVGFIGGMNIALRYVKGTGRQPWRDTMLRVTGLGVYALQRTFLIDWYFVDRTLLNERKYYPPADNSRYEVRGKATGRRAELGNARYEKHYSLLQVVTSGPVVPYPFRAHHYGRPTVHLYRDALLPAYGRRALCPEDGSCGGHRRQAVSTQGERCLVCRLGRTQFSARGRGSRREGESVHGRIHALEADGVRRQHLHLRLHER